MRIDQSYLGVTGVGETIERRLWREGATHWDEFDERYVGPTRAEAIRAYIDDGREALDAEDVHHFRDSLPSASTWRLYETFPDRVCFLDIETTGLDPHTSVVTTVSVCYDGNTRTLVRGDDLTADALQVALQPHDILVTFNGKRFDVPFLEQEFGLSIDVVHLDLLYPCRRLGLTGGLEAVETALGLDRTGPDISGADAVRLWREYERGRDGALETLISYNRDDTEVMVEVVDQVTTALHEEVFVSEDSP